MKSHEDRALARDGAGTLCGLLLRSLRRLPDSDKHRVSLVRAMTPTSFLPLSGGGRPRRTSSLPLKGGGSGRGSLSHPFHKTIDHALLARAIERDGELVAIHHGHVAVAEFLVKHPVAAGKT